MPLMILTGVLLLSLSLIGLLGLPFHLLDAFRLPNWLYLVGAIAFLSWLLDD